MNYYLLGFIIFPYCIFAQNFNKLSEVSFGGNFSDVLEVIPNADGNGYFYYGTSNSSSGSIDHTSTNYGNSDIWLIRTDLGNNILWDKTFGGTGTENGLSAIIIDSFLYVAGVSDSPVSGNKTINTNGGNDIWVLKLDFDGNIIWQNTYGGTGSESYAEIGVFADQIIIFAISQSSNSGNVTLTNNGSLDCWVLLADTLNGTINDQAMIGSSSIEKFGSLDIIDNRIFIMTNSYGSDGDIPIMDLGFSEDIVLFELDSNLDIIQTKGYWGNSIDIGKRLIKKSANEFFLIADSQSSISGDKGSDSFGSSDVWILKLDGNLNVIWDTIYGGTGVDRSTRHAHIDDNGKLVMLCSSSSMAGSGNKSAVLHGFDDMWLLVVNSTTGELSVDYSLGGSGYDSPTGMIPLGNGQLLVIGASESSISGNRAVLLKGTQDTWIVTVDGSDYLFLSEEGAFGQPLFFPNPFEDQITLDLNSQKEFNLITFTTVDGRLLYSDAISVDTTSMTFSFPNYKGVILYTLSGENKSSSGMLIKN